MSTSSIHDLITRLAGPSGDEPDTSGQVGAVDLTESLYVEKLASAVEHMLTEGTPAKPAPVVESAKAEATGVAERLRAQLKAKLVDKSKATSDSKNEMANAIIARLKGMKAQTAPEPEAEENDDQDAQIFYMDEAKAEDVKTEGETDAQTTTEDTSEDSTADTVAKAASANLSLAEVLEASFGADESDKSVTSGDVKTAGVRGDVEPMARKTATDLLRKRLMAKVGKEV